MPHVGYACDGARGLSRGAACHAGVIPCVGVVDRGDGGVGRGLARRWVWRLWGGVAPCEAGAASAEVAGEEVVVVYDGGGVAVGDKVGAVVVVACGLVSVLGVEGVKRLTARHVEGKLFKAPLGGTKKIE